MSARLRRVLAPVLALAICPAIASAALRAPAPRTSAGPVLTAGDATDLAQNLNDATAVQGVCYGWRINVSDSGSGPSGTDEGSSLNANSVSPAQSCTKYVILTADVTYVSDSSESNDSVSWGIDSNLPNPPTPADLKNLGVGGGGLLNDNNDTALTNTVQALPLVVSSKGLAKPVAADLTVRPANPAAAHPTNSPGPDWIRQNTFLFILALCVIAVGLYLIIHQYLLLRRDRKHHKHGEQVHEVLREHTPEGVAHHPPPVQQKPSTVVETWVSHIEQTGGNLPADRKAAVLAALEQAKESGQIQLSAGQMKRIRKHLATEEGATEEQPAAASAEPQSPPAQSSTPESGQPPQQ